MFSSENPNWAEGVTALLSIATLIAVLLAAVQIWNVNKQMHREFEMQYLLRFWQLYDKMSDELKLGTGNTSGDVVLAKDYFQLCEDQIGLRGIGRVTDQTWGFWREDIKNLCGHKFFTKELEKYSTEFPRLSKTIASEGYDPLAEEGNRGIVWRYTHGL